MTQQIMLNRHSQKTIQDHLRVGRGIRNSLPTRMHDVMAMDILGLSWILNDILYDESIIGEELS